METGTYTPQEVSTRGRAIYEERLKAQLEPGNKGKVLIIDILSGDYEMGMTSPSSRRIASRTAAPAPFYKGCASVIPP